MTLDKRVEFLNRYECSGDISYREQHKPYKWAGIWSSMVDEECPICSADISPYESEEL